MARDHSRVWLCVISVTQVLVLSVLLLPPTLWLFSLYSTLPELLSETGELLEGPGAVDGPGLESWRAEILTGEQALARLTRGGGASCSCYNVENKFCCSQSLCTCDALCYNGSALIRLSDTCRDAPPAPPGGPLLPLTCDTVTKASGKEANAFEEALAMVVHETQGLSVAARPATWLGGRREVMWKGGASYLLQLDAQTTNIAHLACKANHLLLLNNATGGAGAGGARAPPPLRADRALLLRSRDFLARTRALGSDGFHATLLWSLLALALRAGRPPGFEVRADMRRHLLLGERPMAGGAVQFEGEYDSASEDRPICFERSIMTGCLKAITYPGGPAVARVFHEQLRSGLGLGPPAASPPTTIRLLYIKRNAGATRSKRVFTPGSERALGALFRRLGFDVREVELAGMSLSQQFAAVQDADVIVGLHGAGLTNAASFGRAHALVFEIQPFKVLVTMFEYMSLNAGIAYMTHQCHRGNETGDDAKFAGVSVAACDDTPACQVYHLQGRPVQLTAEDLVSLESMLALAGEIVRENKRDASAAPAKLEARYPELCKEVQATLNPECRHDFLHSPVVATGRRCILKRECKALNITSAPKPPKAA